MQHAPLIAVCGEALMDVFAERDTASGMALDARVGGSPFNVAFGLARLGQRAAFFGAVSRDFMGERLMRALRDEGVDTGAVARVHAPTTLGLVGTDAQGVPSYAFYGDGGADRQLTTDALATLPAQVAALHLGSFTAVVEPVASTLRTLVEQRRSHCLVSYDPNVRLNVEPDVARWQDMLQWMLARAHLVKISDEDLALLMPGVGPRAFCDLAVAQGVRLAVVTRGLEGAVARSAVSTAGVPAVGVDVEDTVGAGDTFQAALLTWLAEQGRLDADGAGALDEGGLRQALGFAAAAAAVTCSRRGADLPRRAELPG